MIFIVLVVGLILALPFLLYVSIRTRYQFLLQAKTESNLPQSHIAHFYDEEENESTLMCVPAIPDNNLFRRSVYLNYYCIIYFGKKGKGSSQGKNCVSATSGLLSERTELYSKLQLNNFSSRFIRHNPLPYEKNFIFIFIKQRHGSLSGRGNH